MFWIFCKTRFSLFAVINFIMFFLFVLVYQVCECINFFLFFMYFFCTLVFERESGLHFLLFLCVFCSLLPVDTNSFLLLWDKQSQSIRFAALSTFFFLVSPQRNKQNTVTVISAATTNTTVQSWLQHRDFKRKRTPKFTCSPFMQISRLYSFFVNVLHFRMRLGMGRCRTNPDSYSPLSHLYYFVLHVSPCLVQRLYQEQSANSAKMFFRDDMKKEPSDIGEDVHVSRPIWGEQVSRITVEGDGHGST